MNRHVKWFLRIVVAAASLMAAATLIWRTQNPAPGATHHEWVLLTVLAFIPAWGALGLWRFTRHMNARVPGTAQDSGRHLQAWTVFGYIILLLVEIWQVSIYFKVIPAGPDFATNNLIFLRGLIMVFGVAIAVRGNFLGKLTPPVFKGRPAQDPAIWRRYARRSGLVWVAMGALSAISAVWMPISFLRWVWLSTAAMLLATMVIHGRKTKTDWTSWG